MYHFEKKLNIITIKTAFTVILNLMAFMTVSAQNVVMEHAVMDSLLQVVAGEREERMEAVSVRSNLLEWGGYVPQYGMCPMPNVGMEIYPAHGHFTYGFSLDCPWWRKTGEHRSFQMRNYTFESRYYTARNTGGVDGYKGLNVSAYVNNAIYQIGLNEKKGYKGEGYGAGFGAGYVLPLNKRGNWRLDMGAKFGFFVTRYDKYRYGSPAGTIEDGNYYYDYLGKPSDFEKRQYRFTWFGPTRVEVSIVYGLFYRDVKKKGGGR